MSDQAGFDRRTARDLARGHVARALRTNLGEGWPLAEEFGYSDAERAMVAAEIEKMVRALERVNDRTGLL